MDLNCPFRLAVTVLLIAVFAPLSIAQAAHSGFDPGAPQGPSKLKDGIVDFTLKRINSANTDYGKCLTEARTLLLEQTVGNGFFWSNVVALALLGCLFLIIVFQHQIQVRREESTVELLAEYEHALARANAQIDNATGNNNSLKQALAGLNEPVLRAPTPPADPPEPAPSPASKARQTSAQPASRTTLAPGAAKPASERAAAPAKGAVTAAKATERANQMGLFVPDTDLVIRINGLEQQLAHFQADNEQLRLRITEGDRRLEAEQQKNRQLKGA